jgi:single-stranded-DNA-specific exonuclease
LGTKKWFEEQGVTRPNMAQYLDLVALGTVADVVPLDRNNRIMVKHGLERIRMGKARPGIQALIEISGRVSTKLKAQDLGFSLAPRLNAAGRLDDMSLGIHCLLAETLEQAQPLARHLDELNQERRQIEGEMQVQALAELQEAFSCAEQKILYQHGISLFQPHWHQGVIGILAGRIKEKFSKPTIVFARGAQGELKGSARSISGINIRDILARIDSKHPGLLLKFGGHAMAAGLAIQEENFNIFAQNFNQEIANLDQVVEIQLFSDGPLAPLQLSIGTAEEINQAGPWGQQFPEPAFDNIFRVLEQRLVGQYHLKLLLQHPDAEVFYDAIAFNVNLDLWPNHRARWLRLVYHLDVNEYQGRRRLQLLVQNLTVVEAEQTMEVQE